MADTLIREGTAFQSQPLSPVPQYWNVSLAAYEKVQGLNGALRTLLYDASGNPLLTTTNPGKVDIQSAIPAGNNIIGQAKITDGTTIATVDAISGKLNVKASDLETILNTLATQATLASLLGQADITISALRDALRGLDSKTMSDLATLLTAIKDTAGIKKITDALPAGTNNIGDVDIASAIPAGSNVIGKVGIDQTTPGTTNGVQINAALPAGTNNIGDVDVISLPSLPTGDNNIGNIDIVSMPVIGTHANAWNAVAVSAGGDSTVIDMQYQSNISAFGNASAATTITAYVSQDGTNFYKTASEVVLSGTGDFHFSFVTGARYVRLKSSGAATITATIAGK